MQRHNVHHPKTGKFMPKAKVSRPPKSRKLKGVASAPGKAKSSSPK